jgi:hypothetical protein
LPIVDISEAGAVDQNKKITVQNLFQAIPVDVGVGEGSSGAGISIKNRLAALPTTGTNANIAWLESTSGFAAGSLLLGSRPSTGSVVLSANGAANLVVVPSTGNVGIGTSAPAAKLHVETIPQAINQSGSVLFGPNTDYGFELRNVIDSGGFPRVELRAPTAGAGPMLFFTGATERMRIDSSGGVSIQTSLLLRYAGINVSFLGYDPGAGAPTGGTLAIVNQGNDGSGSNATGVGLGRSATSWATYSDERGKANLIPIEDGLSKIGTLRSVTGHYAEDLEQTSRSFLIAQDVQAVLPEAVDASDPDKLSLRYTEVIPLLVAALKESKERIETLEARLTAAGIA